MRRLMVAAMLTWCLAVVSTQPARADLLENKGRITFLRVHDVARVSDHPLISWTWRWSFNSTHSPARASVFNCATITTVPRAMECSTCCGTRSPTISRVIGYNVTPPKVNGVIIRVAVVKQ